MLLVSLKAMGSLVRVLGLLPNVLRLTPTSFVTEELCLRQGWRGMPWVIPKKKKTVLLEQKRGPIKKKKKKRQWWREKFFVQGKVLRGGMDDILWNPHKKKRK